jgi:hypothetical protein
MSQANRVRIELKPSMRLTFALATAHLVAAIVLAITPLAIAFRVLLGALVVASAWHCLRRHALRVGPHAVAAMEVERDGNVQLTLRSGAEIRGRILGDSFVNPLLTVVNLRDHDSGKRHAVVLAADSADPQALRVLRVWLRFKVELV